MSLRPLTRILATIILILSAYAPSKLQATTFIQRPFAEHVQKAPQLIRGTVEKIESDWGTDSQGTRRIYTFIQILVSEVLKGDAQSIRPDTRLTIRELGGEKDGVGLMISGTASFQLGEEVVVFVSRESNDDRSYDLSGLMMGKLEVQRDPDSGEEWISGPAISFSDQHPHGSEATGGPQGKKKWSLKDLRELTAKKTTIADAPHSTNLHQSKSESNNVALAPSKNPAAPESEHDSPPVSTHDDPLPQSSQDSSAFWLGIGLAVLSLGFITHTLFFRQK